MDIQVVFCIRLSRLFFVGIVDEIARLDLLAGSCSWNSTSSRIGAFDQALQLLQTGDTGHNSFTGEMVMGFFFPGPCTENNHAGFFCNTFHFTFRIWFPAYCYRLPASGIAGPGNIFHTWIFSTAKDA